ncbi:hypothetical protein GWI33_011507 [Rhynchophorus ferrugineus]|uniref:Sm domain-containing protein n=1 Tax=Rhynchophorus ferrugineus TaxID=354439 RepID=A0A834I7V4_RHYFE|nr:hypothetical protein GWI33_011507 [Rhynchophorus ferrugineus]
MVITRNDKGVRGYCTGVLIAFDKHWNLALTGVVEVWIRPAKSKYTVLLDKDVESEEVPSRPHPISPPVIEKKKISKNVIECRQTVSQMIMRGEHVVLIHAVLGNT